MQILPNVLSNSSVSFWNRCIKKHIALWLCLFLFVSGWSSVRWKKFISFVSSQWIISFTLNVLDYILSHECSYAWFLSVGNYMVTLSSPHLSELLLGNFVVVTPCISNLQQDFVPAPAPLPATWLLLLLPTRLCRPQPGLPGPAVPASPSSPAPSSQGHPPPPHCWPCAPSHRISALAPTPHSPAIICEAPRHTRPWAPVFWGALHSSGGKIMPK